MSSDSPLTFRPGKDRLARLRAYQEREGLTLTGALHRLLDEGMDRAKVTANGEAKPKKKRMTAADVRNGGTVITQAATPSRWKI